MCIWLDIKMAQMNSKGLFLHQLDFYFHSSELTTISIFLCYYPEIVVGLQTYINDFIHKKITVYVLLSTVFFKLTIDLTGLPTSTHLCLSHFKKLTIYMS